MGAVLVFFIKDMNRKFMDAALGFAAGAMIYVVIKEAIPESQRGGNSDWAAVSIMAGFTIMMILDVALG